MKKIINTCLLLALVIGPSKSALAEDASPSSADASNLQATVESPNSDASNQAEEVEKQKKAEAEAKAQQAADEEAKARAQQAAELEAKAKSEQAAAEAESKAKAQQAEADAKAKAEQVAAAEEASKLKAQQVAADADAKARAQQEAEAKIRSQQAEQFGARARASHANTEARNRAQQAIAEGRARALAEQRANNQVEVSGEKLTSIPRTEDAKPDYNRSYGRPSRRHHIYQDDQKTTVVTSPSKPEPSVTVVSPANPYRTERGPRQMPSRGTFSSTITDTGDATRPTPHRPVVPPKNTVVIVEKQKPTFTSNIQSTVQAAQTGTIVTVQRPDEQRYRERELRERELRRREWELRARENQLRNREFQVSEQERAFRDRDWYNRKLRIREWEDINARDQELRYLLWREQQLSQYYWRDKGRVCRYVTYYKTGVRTNNRVTICEKRRGVTTCFHPKRYFIYPVTKLVCYRSNDRRLIGTIIRPYPYSY